MKQREEKVEEGRVGPTSVHGLLSERVRHSHRRGGKPKPIEERKLSDNAKKLIRRILRQTSDETPVWCEANDDVAKALGIDRSTVVRNVGRLREAGVLIPLEDVGGRSRPSKYQVDRGKAGELLRRGSWAALVPAEHVGQASKQGQLAEPAEKQSPLGRDTTRNVGLGAGETVTPASRFAALLPAGKSARSDAEELGRELIESLASFLRGAGRAWSQESPLIRALLAATLGGGTAAVVGALRRGQSGAIKAGLGGALAAGAIGWLWPGNAPNRQGTA